MSQTLLVLDRQASAKTFSFGDTSATGQALVTVNKGTAAATTVVLDVKGSQNIAGDLNLTGNLKITGSIDEQTVTNLAVNDLTITTNKGGSTPSDDTAGLKVEGTSATVVGAILFKAASASKFSIGDGTTQKDIVDVSSTQTLTNKTIGATQISGNISGNAANVTGTVLVANGGTGIVSTTVNGVILGGTTTTGNFQNAGTGSVSGNVLTSNGTGVAPTWQAVSATAYMRSTAVSGTQDGSNKIFTIANAVSSGSEQVFINGMLLMPGSSNDYLISSTTVTFQAAFTAPAATDVIRVYGNY